MAYSEEDIKKCKEVLEDFLLTSEDILISTGNRDAYLDSDIANYLLKNKYKQYLVEDVSSGFQVGGISEIALIHFAREKKIFEGKVGKFYIEETYAEHSVRLFQAWYAKEK